MQSGNIVPNDDSTSVFDNLDEFCKSNFGNVMQVIRSSHALPKAGDDHEFYCSFSGFREFLEYQKKRLLTFISTLMRNNGYKSNFAELAASTLNDVDDTTDRMIECNDGLLERVAALLDSCEKDKINDDQKNGNNTNAFQTSNSNADVVVSSWNKQKKGGHTQTFRLMHARNIIRPQLKFKDAIDNTNTPFIPKIRIKPNALKPLSNRLSRMNSSDTEKQSDIAPALANLIDSMRSSGEEDQTIYRHPYEHELNIWEPLPQQLEKVEPQMYTSLDPSSCIYIDQLSQLQRLLETLKNEKEVAVDLEHHSYRSFQGITCLMQISTRSQDYIVDTLALRADLWILNEVFTDPTVVKVLHGADSDIAWLQRDFGIYVVNMFDTGQAARLLSKARFSLEYLADQYCNVQFDKKYQLADWRIRPLPEEMAYYAQGDTHYLLYIYDMMRNELIDKANGETRLLRVAFLQSRDLCLLRYEKPITTATSHMQLLEKMQRRRVRFKLRSPPQLEALRLLFLWRDGMARKEDESSGYVLPNHMLLQIAEILPKEAQGVLACCNPIPPLLRQHVLAVHQLIKDARHVAPPSSSAVKYPEVEAKVPVPAKADFDSTNLLTCPHDLSQTNKTANIVVKPCNVIMQKQSSFLGPFESDAPKKGVFLSKSDNHNCAFTKSNSKNAPSREMRETIVKKAFWNPFSLYFPSGGDKTKKVSPPTSHPDQPLTLKYVLSGDFQWKMRDLGNTSEEEEIVEEKPKTFGTKVEISDDAKRTTEEQVQALKSMMSRKKQNAPLAPAPSSPSLLISMEGIPKSLRFRPNKDNLINQKITKKFVNPHQKQQQNGSKKRAFSHDNFSKESKRPFQPYVYSKDEYKQFRRPKEAKRKRRPGKPKRF